MSSELEAFIEKARAKHLSDDEIRTKLVSAGWEEPDVSAALNGDDLVVPLPPSAKLATPTPPAAAHHTGIGRPSITALQAALQHVLLWVFTITSTVMISIVSFALFGSSNDTSSEVLITYVVLELVTFVPFLLLYLRYLKAFKKQPDMMTGRVWSIITVVLHSLTLIGSVISMILVLILVHNEYFKAGLIASILVSIMNALVVAAYVLANFAKRTDSTYRKYYLQYFPAALFVLIASLGLMSLVRVGPLRSDDQTKQNMVSAVKQIHEYARNHDALPSSLEDLPDAPKGVTYQRKSSSNYEICGAFKINHTSSDGYGSYYDNPQDDSYVSEYDFQNLGSGTQCREFYNGSLANGRSTPITKPPYDGCSVRGTSGTVCVQ